MRKYLRNLTAAALLLVATGSVPAWAHAVIVAASPSAGQHVPAGKVVVRIEFNSRIDKERSRLQLTAPSGNKATVPIDPAGEPLVMTGTTADLSPGDYVLRWQVLALDGHITRGDIPFVVGN
jgi:methionine-rich copper-binding protein CopC